MVLHNPRTYHNNQPLHNLGVDNIIKNNITENDIVKNNIFLRPEEVMFKTCKSLS